MPCPATTADRKVPNTPQSRSTSASRWRNRASWTRRLKNSTKRKVPGYAPACQEPAGFEGDPEKRFALIEEGLVRDPDQESRGMLLLIKAAIANRRGDRGAATKILSEIVLDESAPQTIAGLAHVSLRRMYERAEE